MKTGILDKFCLLSLLYVLPLYVAAGVPREESDIPALENPMSVQYLKANLRKRTPRLVLNAPLERNLSKQLRKDPVIKNMYEAIRMNAEKIQREPLLERTMIGRRLLSVSREMLYRMNMLCMVYRVEKDPVVLRRINDEVAAVCGFSDWNPSHYLDVAEMSMAVAIAVDWAGDDLPEGTVEAAKVALIEKGIVPSYSPEGNTGWVKGTHNWNQVCHGGMIAASIAIAEKDPELAARTIHRALEGIPHALVEYGPDGVYPEGSTYWNYGTSFSVVTSAMLESAFGTDFGLAEYPAFQESAVFRVLSVAPSGRYYNYSDCGDRRSGNGDVTLAWFGVKTGNSAFFERERFLRPPESMGELERLAGVGLVWLAQFEPRGALRMPTAWKGDGANPVVFFRGGEDDPNQYYFGAKGGRGSVNHGNMDGGSFVFELDGIRWVVDPGNQSYHALEKTGFNLWDRCQNCERWALLTKNNYGHSTLTVDGQHHRVDGLAAFTEFVRDPEPSATLDLSPTFEGQLASAERSFIKDGPRSLRIEDQIETTEDTELVTWQLITTAEVELHKGGALLHQQGKKMRVDILSHPDLNMSVIMLDPPPMELDRRIEGLKRLELRLPAYLFEEGAGTIAVRLSGE